MDDIFLEKRSNVFVPFEFLNSFSVLYFCFCLRLNISVDIDALFSKATYYDLIFGFAIEFMYHFFTMVH